MDIINVLPLLSAILVFILGIIVFKNGKKEKINFTFVLFSFAITIWMFATFMMFINKDNIDRIIFWDKIVYGGVVFIPAIMYHFGLALTNNKIIKGKFLLIIGYLLSLFFFLLIPTGFFINDAFIYEWGAHSRAQIFHHVFLFYFSTYLILWFIIVYKYYKLPISSVEREKIKYSFLAFIILASLGSLGFLPAYGIGIYPFAYVSGVIFTIIIAYTIIVHRLMDVKMVMRRSSVYLATLASIVVPAFFIEHAFSAIFSGYSIWSEVFILTVAISIFPPIKNYYYRFANKYLFSSLYDSKEVVAELSDKLRTTLEVDKIHALVSKILTSSFHSKSIGVLFFNKKRKNYTLRYNDGFNIGKLKTIKNNQEIYDLYVSANKIIVLEELKNYSYDRYKEYIDELTGYNMEILVPLNVGDKNLGILVLGPKEAGDMYNDEDLGVLKIVSAQMAISLENALLYEETKRFNKKLKQEIEIATTDLLSANEKLKKLDVAKSEFISIASHQLRTPLTAIKGYISMMIEGDFGELTPVEKEALEKVFNSNERLIKLVENLLNVSRIESGRLQFNFEEVQLEKMVESVMDELSNYAKKKDLTLEYKKPETPLPKVNIDDEKIRQVVMNLIDNAIKYTKQGTVTVSLAQVENNLEFRVSDSGMGISPTDLPNLFQKFSRGTGASLTHTEGTGLGLYVARQMIEAHQGKIWAESKGEAMGSRFCFKLPIIQQPTINQ